jgi:hypothetical protein
MNIALFGYILAWLGVIYATVSTILVFIYYRQLSELQKRLVTEINLGKESITFLISVAYIATYHIS